MPDNLTNNTMKTTNHYVSLLSLVLLGGLFWATSCDPDLEPDKDQTGNPTNPNTPVAIDPDQASEHLKLVNATRISGQPPTGVEGAIWNDVKDTIFLMRGLPIGQRVNFLHDPKVNVTGFYVYVPGASYYYDVPSVPEEARDSTDVVYIDAEFPVADFKDYPISFPIQLMPYVDGIPFKSFIETVVIEDPNDPDVCKSILRDRGGSPGAIKAWQWEFTIRQYKGEILNFWAPGVRVGTNVLLGGCCTDKGKSILGTDPGGAGCKKNNPGPGFTWVEFPSNAGRTSLWEFMNIWADGTVQLIGGFDDAAIIPDTRDFCNESVGLAYNYYGRYHDATHDFTPGANTMNLQFQFSQVPPVSFLSENTYELVYTCNRLVLSRGSKSEGEEWGYVYKLYDDDLFAFHLEWYDNQDNPQIGNGP